MVLAGSQHNEHRLFFSRLVPITDYWLAAETNVTEFVAAVIMLAVLAVLMVRLSWGAGLRGRVGAIWATGLTLALLFWSVQHETLMWGLPFVQYFGVLLAAAATFSMLCGSPMRESW
jgi:hypothetical protein